MDRSSCRRSNRFATVSSTFVTLLATTVLLNSCGGGGAVVAGGVGTGGTGVVIGTVTGFGSIIVDGTPLSSSTGRYQTNGNLNPVMQVSAQQVNLGQNVQIQLDSQGNPATVAIEPQLVGQVTAVDAATNTLMVNGLSVKLNLVSSVAPVTVLGGYGSTAAIQVGDWVRIHGTPAYDSLQTPFLQASSLRQIAANPGYIRVSGPISNLTSHSFMLNNQSFSYTPATPVLGEVWQTGAGLSNGAWVSVWSSAAGVAGQIQVATLTGMNGSAVTLSGVVSLSGSSQWLVGGIPVVLPVFMPSLNSGQYVTVKGTANTQGQLNVQQAISFGNNPVSVSGTIAEMASPSNFTVRGTVVALTSSTRILSSNGTPLTTAALHENIYVQIQGTVVGNILQASTLTVVPAIPSGAVVDYLGTVTTAGNGQVSLVLLDGSVVQAVLSSSVVYTNGTVTDLAPGALVDVEGTAGAQSNGMITVEAVNFWKGSNGAVLPSPATTSFQASGPVYNYQPASQTFSINGLTVQITAGVVLPSNFGNGNNVDVLLSLSGNQLLATAIYPDDSQ